MRELQTRTVDMHPMVLIVLVVIVCFMVLRIVGRSR